MTGWTGFVKTTVIGGVVFLVPFIVVLFILGKAFALMRGIAQPLSAVVPMDSAADVIVVDLIALALILLVCFLAGLVARAAAAGRVVKGLEVRVLSRVPFYHFVKGMTESIVEAEGDTTLRSVLLRFDDYSQVAFEVERLASGEVVVYLPGAPNPWSGTVCVVAAERVTPLDVPMLAAVQHVKHLGKGSGRLLAQA